MVRPSSKGGSPTGKRRSVMKRDDLMIKEGTGVLSKAEEMILSHRQGKV